MGKGIKQQFKYSFLMSSFGVTLRIESNENGVLNDVKENLIWAFARQISIKEDSENVVHSFGVEKKDGEFILYRDGEYFSRGPNKLIFLKYTNAIVRNRVAEFAPDHTFIHAGSVGWKGRSIIFPGKSFCGKTTLVNELIKQGAEYYSDEYAVLDNNGLIHPFARPLSLRTGDGKRILSETEVSTSEIDCVVGTEPIPIGAVFLFTFEPDLPQEIEHLTTGQGILETLTHTIPFARDPETSLKRLKTSLNRAIILKGIRGDAKAFALTVLSFIDNN